MKRFLCSEELPCWNKTEFPRCSKTASIELGRFSSRNIREAPAILDIPEIPKSNFFVIFHLKSLTHLPWALKTSQGPAASVSPQGYVPWFFHRLSMSRFCFSPPTAKFRCAISRPASLFWRFRVHHLWFQPFPFNKSPSDKTKATSREFFKLQFWANFIFVWWQ